MFGVRGKFHKYPWQQQAREPMTVTIKPRKLTMSASSHQTESVLHTCLQSLDGIKFHVFYLAKRNLRSLDSRQTADEQLIC